MLICNQCISIIQFAKIGPAAALPSADLLFGHRLAPRAFTGAMQALVAIRHGNLPVPLPIDSEPQVGRQVLRVWRRIASGVKRSRAPPHPRFLEYLDRLWGR